jgi:hypothetical protein
LIIKGVLEAKLRAETVGIICEERAERKRKREDHEIIKYRDMKREICLPSTHVGVAERGAEGRRELF